VSESKYNNGEADLVVEVLRELLEEMGLKTGDVGVISPYNA
jgi:superfamily I DNA and/or RNA helicase